MFSGQILRDCPWAPGIFVIHVFSQIIIAECASKVCVLSLNHVPVNDSDES